VINGPRPMVKTLDQVELDGLAARMWEMNGRSGMSFSARAVTKAGSHKPARTPVAASSNGDAA
jgi:hypothetical protein